MIRAAVFITISTSASVAIAVSPEADALSFVTSANKCDSDSITAESPDLFSVLNFVRSTVDSVTGTEAPRPAIKHQPRTTSALDFISGSYAGHDYYSTGAWDDDCNFFLPPSPVTPPVTGIPYTCTESKRITSRFGYRESFGRMHFGTDIAMRTGSEVSSPFAGEIARSGYDRGYGLFVFIAADNGLELRFGHLSKITVEKGERIQPGQIVALSGNSGNSTGPHLHIEVRYRGTPIDPQRVFDF